MPARMVLIRARSLLRSLSAARAVGRIRPRGRSLGVFPHAAHFWPAPVRRRHRHHPRPRRNYCARRRCSTGSASPGARPCAWSAPAPVIPGCPPDRWPPPKSGPSPPISPGPAPSPASTASKPLIPANRSPHAGTDRPSPEARALKQRRTSLLPMPLAEPGCHENKYLSHFISCYF